MDQGLKHALKELKIEDMYEVQDIRLRMPRMNLTNFEHWDTFLENPDASKKLRFLQKTVYNTKQIKKTLDLRKISDLERTGRLKEWQRNPNKIIRNKINIRRLKLKVRRRMEQETLKLQGEVKKNFECPVYLCNTKFATEDDLISHYNAKHQELVELGLTLRKSKNTRKEDRAKKLKEAANKISINTEPNQKKEDPELELSSDNSDLNEDSNEIIGASDRKPEQDQDSFDLYGPGGKGLLKPGVDGDIDNDSDLEDLLVLEKF